MSLCSLCGLTFAGDSGLCSHHPTDRPQDWGLVNRIMCDFFHRGVEPTQLEPPKQCELERLSGTPA